MSSWRRADILPHSIVERSLSEMDTAPNETRETEIEIFNLSQQLPIDDLISVDYYKISNLNNNGTDCYQFRGFSWN